MPKPACENVFLWLFQDCISVIASIAPGAAMTQALITEFMTTLDEHCDGVQDGFVGRIRDVHWIVVSIRGVFGVCPAFFWCA